MAHLFGRVVVPDNPEETEHVFDVGGQAQHAGGPESDHGQELDRELLCMTNESIFEILETEYGILKLSRTRETRVDDPAEWVPGTVRGG